MLSGLQFVCVSVSGVLLDVPQPVECFLLFCHCRLHDSNRFVQLWLDLLLRPFTGLREGDITAQNSMPFDGTQEHCGAKHYIMQRGRSDLLRINVQVWYDIRQSR